jgi:two-component sensor histidine kinase
VATLLRRFSGTRQAVIGRLHLRASDGGVAKHRCRGCRIGGPTPPGEEVLLLVRLESVAHGQFRALTEKIVALNAEIRRTKRTQLQLEAALEQSDTLLRELHHRVKNNLQTLLGILSLAEQRATVPKAREVIGDARMRVEALAVLQRLLYAKGDLASVDGAAFLAAVCANVERAFRRPGITVRVQAAEAAVSLDVASALGLIANELLTNAFKHAFPDRKKGEISVRLSQEDGPDGALVLVVADDGRGLGPGQEEGTGLTLVRGLAQQQGGACAIETAAGVRCTVTLRDRQHSRAPPPLD